MLQKITAFKADDDFITEDEHEALLHQYDIEKAKLIDAFLNDAGSDYTQRGKATALRILNDMIDFSAMNGLTIPNHPQVGSATVDPKLVAALLEVEM